LGNRDEAEDVLQRFSLRALERASDLRDVHTVRGWLSRILASTIVDHQRRAVRRRRREVAMEQDDIERLAVEPDVELDGAVCNCLYKLLPTLKPDYAEVIWRADILGEPRDRIAVSLGTTLNNVTVRIHRGRQALKKRLEEMCLTCPVHGFLDCRCDEAERIRQQRAAAMS
jgi:RNA polymerase sigma-70 factor (ECF subfamily)